MPRLNELFKAPLEGEEKKQLVCFSPRRLPHERNFQLYPLAQFHELLKVLQEENKDLPPVDEDEEDVEILEEAQNRYRVRFALDENMQLWFAKEGPPNVSTPAHLEMTESNRCVTAGNLFVSSDYSKIMSFNHLSGDFRPEFDTLKWVLALLAAYRQRLVATGIELDPAMIIEKVAKNGMTLEKYALEENLDEWALATFGEEKLSQFEQAQPLSIRRVQTDPLQAENSRKRTADPQSSHFKSKKLGFFVDRLNNHENNGESEALRSFLSQ